jgi:DNA-binding response OmpR family regulator
MRILLVEDDVAIAKAVAEALGDKGYTVEMAEDGQTGLAFAETGLFDLIVLDLTLPKLNGIPLCQKLRQQNLSVSVLMLTARDTTADKIVGLDAGADDSSSPSRCLSYWQGCAPCCVGVRSPLQKH